MKIEKIFFDMDGVLADFDRGIIEICHAAPRDQSVPDEAADRALWENVKKAGHFYDRLEPVPGALSMFGTLYEKYGSACEILSGIPKPRRGIDTAGDDKRAWAARALSPDLKVNIVYREEKKDYVKGKGCILIDDLEKNIREWEREGGTGILFTSAAEVLSEIRELEEN